ncbi:MAG: thioredoxin [Agarilytica sp.]
MNPNIVDITLENAQTLLVEESFKRPVLIDFWASWCEPCKNLIPILEKLAGEYDGRFLLAKVDSDEFQQIASQFGVRSLPTVILMKDGQPVDGFSGLKSESEVREVLDKVLPKPWDIQHSAAKAHIELEEWSAALELLREAYEASHSQADIALSYTTVLTQLKRYQEASEVLSKIKLADQDNDYEQVKAALELAQEAQKAPELQALEEQYTASPTDYEIAFQLAVQYSQHDYKQEALVLLYQIIQKDLNFQSGEAKKVYMDILAVLGKGDPVAAEYQRKLYTLLY